MSLRCLEDLDQSADMLGSSAQQILGHPSLSDQTIRACFGSAAYVQQLPGTDEELASKFAGPASDTDERELYLAFIAHFGSDAEPIWRDMIQRAATWRAARGCAVLPDFKQWSLPLVIEDMLEAMQPVFASANHPPALAYATAGHMFYRRSCLDADCRALDAMLEDLRPLPDAAMRRIEHCPAIRLAQLGHLARHISSLSERCQSGCSWRDRCPPQGAGRVLLWNELQGTVLGCVLGLQAPRNQPTIEQFFSVQPAEVCSGGDKLTLYDGKETDLADFDPTTTQLKRRTCTCVSCDRYPRYADPGVNTATHCGLCRRPEMVDVVAKRCTMAGCSILPSFGFPGGPRVKCAAHKAPGMERKTATCQHAGCTLVPIFGIPGGARQWCGPHRDDGGPEVEILYPRCQHEGCRTIPSFGVRGTLQRRWCGKHRDDGGEEVTSLDRKCDHDGCTVAPCYGYPGAPRQWCNTYKGDGGEGVECLGDQCQEVGCRKHPCFGFLAPEGQPSTREW
ncbi:hypothetical protein WJX73_009804 [Symbiochloris irregularis]|uniref:Uncharacterized protein n=1 Tax=Symbiochloris irregularis TaxID=706552 RepID=A0AAW1NL64_9CHLO